VIPKSGNLLTRGRKEGDRFLLRGMNYFLHHHVQRLYDVALFKEYRV
jgi:hypothetical protein